jgi:hypothetical protein
MASQSSKPTHFDSTSGLDEDVDEEEFAEESEEDGLEKTSPIVIHPKSPFAHRMLAPMKINFSPQTVKKRKEPQAVKKRRKLQRRMLTTRYGFAARQRRLEPETILSSKARRLTTSMERHDL